MSKAFGYVRVSTQAQVTDGNGLDVQRAKIAGFAQYAGLELVAVEADEGVSGAATDNRPGLHRALRAALDAGRGATLIVYKLDRLGRSAVDVQEIVGMLLDEGIRLVSIADGVDSASGMGAALLKLLVSILSTFAELEKESIRTRMLDGRKRASAENRPYASEPAYGRRVAEDGTLEVDVLEKAAVERANVLRKHGKSIREIGRQLEAEGLTPRRAEHWTPFQIAKFLGWERKPKTSTRARTERVKAAITSSAP